VNQRAAVCSVVLSFAATFAAYAYSAPFYPSPWDTGELQTVPYILGIAHPTGFPFFTLAGWLFTHVFAIGSVAWRMNVFSGLCVATAAGATALIALLLGAGAVEACLGALLFGWCSAVWNKGSHVDPHAMSLMFVMLVLALAVIYVRRGNARYLLAACACGGLGMATHPEVLYSLPAIAVALCVRSRPSLRVFALAAAALVLPLAFYAYLPLRSAYVVAHHLDPNAAPPILGTVPSELDANHPSTLAGFIDVVSGRQFGASDAALALFDVRKYPAALAYWWQQSYAQIPPFAIVLGAIGALGLLVRDWRLAAVVFAGTFGVLPFVYAFKAVEGDPNRYFLPSFALMAALAAASSRLPIPRTEQGTRSILVSIVLFGAVALQWMDNSGGSFRGRYDPGGQGTIDTVRRDIPDGAIVVAIWIDATPLEYAEFVDRSLGTRLVVPGWPGEFIDRYAAWNRVKPVYIFADSHAMDNIRANFSPKSITDVVSSDGYHHIVRVHSPAGAPR
jgi:hypothetical protein